MTQSIDLNDEARAKLDEYLDAVDQALSSAGLARPERRNITDDLEAQILEMLEARAGRTPLPSDVEAVLAELDPPEAYAARTDESAAPAVVPPGEREMSRTALLGAAWAPFAFIAMIFLFTAHAVPMGPDGQPLEPVGPSLPVKILLYIIAAVGVTAPFGTTVCGISSISQVRNSAGRLYGMVLAVIDALLFPLLALDALIYYFWRLIAATIQQSELFGLSRPIPDNIILLASLLTCALVDFVIFYAVWRAVRVPEGGASIAESPEDAARRATLAKLALGLCIGGLIVSAALIVLLSSQSNSRQGAAYLVFLAGQFTAFLLGVLSFQHPFGKAATIASVALMAGSLLFLG